MTVPEANGRCPVDHTGSGLAATTSTTTVPTTTVPATTVPATTVPATTVPTTAVAAKPAIPATALPGPTKAVPLQMMNYWRRPAAFMEECRKRYGSRFVIKIRIPARPLYVLSDADDIKQMFLAPDDVLHTGNGSATLEKYFGQSGLAWLDEGEHKARRRHVVQCVHGSALQRIEESVSEVAKDEVAGWPQGQDVSLYRFIHHLTIRVIREVIFGPLRPTGCEELLDVFEQMTEFNYKLASTLMIHRMSPRAVRVLTAIRPLGLHRFLKLRERADALIAEAIEERRNGGQLGDDLLSVLLGLTYEDGTPLSGRELRDEIMTMFLAGTETTAAALTWAFEYLSREHEVRERLIAEIGTGDDAYLTATIQEVLRLRPSVPQIILREVMKPIEIGGVRYEPGMLLWASAYLMHRDPAIYPDPYAFRPERFLGTKPGMFTWIPYGGGRIRCLGNVVAELEMKAVLREALSRYELGRPDPRPERVRTHLITPLPANGARVRLQAKSPQASLV